MGSPRLCTTFPLSFLILYLVFAIPHQPLPLLLFVLVPAFPNSRNKVRLAAPGLHPPPRAPGESYPVIHRLAIPEDRRAGPWTRASTSKLCVLFRTIAVLIACAHICQECF